MNSTTGHDKQMQAKAHFKTLAVKLGLRLNHHNVEDLRRMCESYGFKYEMEVIDLLLVGNGEINSSIFIGPFIDNYIPELPYHVERPQDGTAALAEHLAKNGQILVHARKCEPEVSNEYARFPSVVGPPQGGTVTITECGIPIVTDDVQEIVFDAPVRLDFAQLQLQQRAWVGHNFPEQLKDPTRQDDSLLGLVEELGELARSILKLRQGIRGNEEHWIAQRKDAVGDLVIFLASFCNSYGISLQECVETAWAEVRERDWVKYPKSGRPEEGQP